MRIEEATVTSVNVGVSPGSLREQGPVVALINSEDAPPGRLFSPSRPTFPALGLLRLGSALRQVLSSAVTVRYIDVAAIPGGNEVVREYLVENAQHLVVVGCTLLTSNYPPTLDLLRLVKAANPKVVTVVGNDHFSVFCERIMRRQKHCIDYGFLGNDVVGGFTRLVADIVEDHPLAVEDYPGLVFRSGIGVVVTNPEEPGEYSRLAPTDYSLVTSFDPFQGLNYCLAQRRAFGGAMGGGLRGTTIDLARGCPKFRASGPSGHDRRCSFCAIVPGTAPMVVAPAERAWETIHTAVDAGFNFLFVTADDLLLGFSSLVRTLADSKPVWFKRLEDEGAAPQFLAYSRADAFVRCRTSTIEAASSLGLKRFFVGFDYFDPLSLEISRKPLSESPGAGRLMHGHNIEACEIQFKYGFRVIGGVVMNHLGMTRRLLESNLAELTALLRANRGLFIAVEFGPLCPIPGSRDYEYLTDPELAESVAAKFELNVDKTKLRMIAEKYREQDAPLVGELTEDYVAGCCPEITMDDIEEFTQRLVAECRELGIPCGGP